jgi:glutathione synthase/RimK-type ligase-like ATP-grasp enzyme
MRTFVGSLALAARPTVTIEMDRIKFAGIPRGRRLRHRLMGKVAESQALSAAGIPTPRTVAIEPNTTLDPAEWGPYVVVKPNIGKRGAFVWIHKTRRVKYKPSSEFPADHYGRRGMIAQEFIYTGEWPVAYRVLTYFGRVILAIRYDGERNQPPLLGLTDFRRKGGYRIVAPAIGCTISTVGDPEILDLARRTHAAFPEIPSLGVDVVRDANTGKLFVLETNPYGDSWTLTSGSGRSMEKQFGLDFHAQFDAINVITDTSIEMARRYAR